MAKKRARKEAPPAKPESVSKQGVTVDGKLIPFGTVVRMLNNLDNFASKHSLLGYEGEFWKARVQVESVMEDLAIES